MEEKENNRITDLCQIYGEMDEEGKKEMISVVENYLTIQKSQISINKF